MAEASPPLLVPYRAIGLVADAVPFAVNQLGTETFVTTAVGRSFQVFTEKKLRLAFSGPQLARAVTALAASGERTAVAFGATVHVYERAEQLTTCEGEHSAPVRHVLFLGESTLLSVCEGGTLIAWSLPSGSVLRRLHAGFAPTAICHPATYLNKVLLGGSDGRLQLHNVRSGAKVHEFTGWGSAVLCIEQSPALDVVGIGHADGRIVIHNLKADRSVLTLHHEAGEACTGLAFRTDGLPLLVSASAAGPLHVWHLEKRSRLTSLPDAHSGGVGAIHFVRGQPLLITMGAADNALNVWTFDRPDGGARVLRSRSGHSAPPTTVRFHADALIGGGGPAGQAYVLSGGADRTVRQSSVWSTQQDAEYSQRREEGKHSMHVTAAIDRRLPPLKDLASSQARERDWANVLTCHVGCRHAYTWETTRRALSTHVLSLSTPSAISACAISACGNYGFLGGESGAIEKFNLQSGTRRATTSPAGGHDGPVRGIATDGLGRSLYTGGSDGSLRTWRETDLRSVGSLDALAPIAHVRHQRDSTLLAVVCDDVAIRIFDVVVGRLVRVLTGHTNTITDAAWSSDGRWVLSTSLDSTIRITDVPSGTTIGWYKVDDPATSIAVSPHGEYIATSHASTCAVCVWANRSHFQSALISPAGDAPQVLEMPVASGVGEEEDEEEEEDDDEQQPEEEDEEESEEDEEEAAASKALAAPAAAQLGSCITLSDLPWAHVRTLVHLDTIQQRNLPIAPPKAPPSAPFFLPTAPGVIREFVAPDPVEEAPASGGDKAAADSKMNGGDDAEEDEWAAAAAAAGYGDDAADGEGGEGQDGGRAAKKARKSRMLRSHGLSDLTTLQQLLRAAGEAAAAAGWTAEDEAAEATDGQVVAATGGAKAKRSAGGEGHAAAVAAYEAVTVHLVGLSPSALDLEIRSIGVVGPTRGGGGEAAAVEELRSAVHFFASQLESGRAFELLEACLSVFLRIHQDALLANPDLRGALKRALRAQQASWGELRETMHGCLCLLSHLCRTQS